MSDANATSVVNPRPVEHLYRLRGVAGELLYVGITNNWPTRMKQHMADKPWWHEVAGVELVGVFGTRAQLEAIERAVIRTEEPIYNVAHNRNITIRRPRNVVRPTSVPGSTFVIGDRVRLVGRPENGSATIVGTTTGGLCWLVTFDKYPDHPWTLCNNEIEQADAPLRFHDYGEGSLTPAERQSVVEQASEYGPEWHFWATRPIGVGWVMEHPEYGEGVVTHFQPMGLDSTVTIRFFDDDTVRELCAEWAPLKSVAK